MELGFVETLGGKRQRLSTHKSAGPSTIEYLEGCRAGMHGQPRNRAALLSRLQPKLLAAMQQREFVSTPYDKAFACVRWLLLLPLTCSYTSFTQAWLQPDMVAGEGCGIHGMAVSPSGTMLATGGHNVNDCLLLDVPSMEPVATIQGHDDWLFGAAWISNRHVVTASRDSWVKLWAVDDAQQHTSHSDAAATLPPTPPLITQPRASSQVHQYCEETSRLVSLSSDGKVVVWDGHLQAQQTAQVKHAHEIVCLSVQGNTIVTGSRPTVTLLDVRQPQPVLYLTSPEPYQGVRSVQIDGSQLMFGTGNGKLYFYDVRAQCYLNVPGSGAAPLHLSTGRGWLEHNTTYRNYFQGTDVRHACYAAAWDNSKSRLFMCGGPIAFGLKGCYLGLWS